MSTEFDAIRDELAEEYSKSLVPQDGFMRQREFKAGFDAAVKLCRDEISRLESELKEGSPSKWAYGVKRKLCKELTIERDKLIAELKEQCRINGIGQERELALMTENKRLRTALDGSQSWLKICLEWAENHGNLQRQININQQALAIGEKVGE